MMTDKEFKSKLNALSELDQLLIGAAYSEHVLPNWELLNPNDDRPRKAIEAKRAFARGEITREELDKALAGAYYAAEDVNHIWEQTSAWFAAYSASETELGDVAICANDSAGRCDVAKTSAARYAEREAKAELKFQMAYLVAYQKGLVA